jgi:tetratricopeptide (TPR) repeat protein
VAPDSFEAHKAMVPVRLAQARYAEALAEAKDLNKRVPDDNQLYGYIADAQMALGDYPAALKSTQWMIDQRPVNAPGLERGAALRDYFGYGEAALEWWNSSLRITSSFDSEERAWILVNMSRVALRMGKAANAEGSARQALDLIANYPLASDALAAALMAQDKPGDAAEVLARRLSAASNVRAEFYFAGALAASGKKAEAAAAFGQFEKDAAARVSQADNANRELIEYYANHGRAGEAVKLGAQEIERRKDIPTLSAYALALAAAGQCQEARVQMDRALEPGIRDAGLFLRAGLIAAKLDDKASAAKYLKKAIEINASSPEAGQAIELLKTLSVVRYPSSVILPIAG